MDIEKIRKIIVLVFAGIPAAVLLSVLSPGGQGPDLTALLMPSVSAHCDTMDGPVVVAARKALDSGKPDPVLVWVREKDEAEIKAAFAKTLAVRKMNAKAKELADMYFFETLVRVHRAGEGAPYTGLKPAGSETEPAIALADETIETGNIDGLVKEVSDHLAGELREKYGRVAGKKKAADRSVEAGREYVEAYVVFIHYVESLHDAISGKTEGHGNGEPSGDESQHQR